MEIQMNCVLFYELVSTSARKEVDLRIQELNIIQCAAYAFPESIEIVVFKGFYAISLPPDVRNDRSARLRRLGRTLASKMPVLCQEAMRHYGSKDGAASSQLFRRVRGKKRLDVCKNYYDDV